MTKGYIYIRTHLAYDIDNAYKVGITGNIPERDSLYATCEITRGRFEVVFEVDIKKMKFIENLLHSEFNHLNIRRDGGTEFYEKSILPLIEPYFQELRIEYRKMEKDEINTLTRKNRVKKTIQRLREFIPLIRRASTIIPRDYQKEVIERDYFKFNSKGMLIWTCGLGKTITSLLISEKYKTILIGVPSVVLMEQWRKAVTFILGNVPCLTVTEDITYITHFLKNNEDNCIVLTTYSSSHKVCKACLDIDFVFDMKILDEVHHLTAGEITHDEYSRRYVEILRVPSIKQLSLTATPKYLSSNENVYRTVWRSYR
jgi:hypothetical protein